MRKIRLTKTERELLILTGRVWIERNKHEYFLEYNSVTKAIEITVLTHYSHIEFEVDIIQEIEENKLWSKQ